MDLLTLCRAKWILLSYKVGVEVEPQRTAANISADLVKPWLRSAYYLSSNAAQGECGHLIPQPVRFIPSLSLSHSLSRSLFPLYTRVRTFTRTHNGRSKFFQGISRLINRLVVWGSSEVQRSRLNPLTGRDNQWQVGPHFSCLPLRDPSPLDRTCGKISTSSSLPPPCPLVWTTGALDSS